MDLPRMTLLAERLDGEEAGWLVRAPAVGRLVRMPAWGTHLTAGGGAAVLRVLRREVELVLPEGCQGLVTERRVEGLRPWVEYGQPLFRLGSGLAAAEILPERAATGGAGADETEIPEGCFAVRSPTHGVFYRRPRPDEPPYAEEGAVVERGAVLGLVEVMKTFSQIVYGREDGLPARAVVRRVVPGDSSEVARGAVLFVIEPA